MTTAEQYAKNAARGAVWLDERMPGWWDIIEVNELNMQDANRCILGQLGSTLAPLANYYDIIEFEDGCMFPQLETLAGLSGDEVIEHGFDRYDEEIMDFSKIDTAWNDLAEAWLYEIMERRMLR